MTENENSPENLRKFLESDDPALVRMGLSMAKGSGVPEELLGEILWMYMMQDDKTIRAAAKSIFIKFAPKDAKQAVKENWKASYRTDSIGNGHRLGILEKALRQTSVNLIEQLIKALSDEHPIRKSAAEALWKLGKPAVKLLIETLDDDEGNVRYYAAVALGKIGDVRAVEPLIRVLSNDLEVRYHAAVALGKIGDVRAVEPLIKMLGKTNGAAAYALGDIGDARAVKPLINVLGNDYKTGDSDRPAEQVRIAAAEVLGKIGDERAVEPLIKMLSDDFGRGCGIAAEEALKELGHEVK